MKSLAVKVWLSVLLVAAGAYAGMVVVRNWRTMQAENDPKSNLRLEPARPIGEFQFTERSGKDVKLGELAGHVSVVNFFFATCPGTCRILNQKVADLQKEFAADDVRFVSITIDPAKDTPNALTTYAKEFTADTDKWWFLTGPLAETQALGKALRLTAVGVDERGMPTHTDEIVVLDRNGVVRGAFDHRDPAKLVKAREKIRELLDEKAEPAVAVSSTKPAATATSTPTAIATPTAAATGAAK
ncbi:MAG: SCO family protein [Pirellulales bacterium]